MIRNARRLLLIVALAVGFASMADAQSKSARPAALENIGNIVGEQFMNAEWFLDAPDAGVVTDILYGNYDGRPGSDLVVIGTRGAVFFNPTNLKQPASSCKFDSEGNSFMRGVDVNRDGVLEFFDTGENSFVEKHAVRLYDLRGRTMWQTDTAQKVVAARPWLRSARSRTLDFAVARRGSLDLLDSTGKMTGTVQRAQTVKYMMAGDLNNDGSEEIILLGPLGSVTFQDARGNVLRESRIPGSPRLFTIVASPNNRRQRFLAIPGNGRLGLFNFDGSMALTLDAPHMMKDEATLMQATPVRLVANQRDYLAVLVQYEQWERSVLYLYDGQAKLVYARVVPGYVTSLAAIRMEPDRERLITGGNGNIYDNRLTGAK